MNRAAQRRPSRGHGPAPAVDAARPTPGAALRAAPRPSNQALQRLLAKRTLQAKLEVGQRRDAYEREADAVAEHITRVPSPRLQRTCAACAREDDEKVRLTPQAGGTGAAPGAAERAVAGLDAGRPLPASERNFFEPRLGQDLGRVRIHTDAAGAPALRARAFTLGSDLAFAPGQWQPGTADGRRLLAHELVHVLQQRGGAPAAIRRDDAGGGSTEFQDTIEQTSSPNSGQGVFTGVVRRTETAPASGSLPRQVVSRGKMKVQFDTADCSVTIPFGYNFVPAAQADPRFCEDPPPAKPVPLVSAAGLNAIKTSVLADVNKGLNGWFDVRLSGACPKGCAGRDLPIRVDAHEDTASPDQVIKVVNRGGRANAGTICARSWDRSTAVHEGGHQVLGVGDEYPERDERFRQTVPEWFREERVRRDNSIMGPEEDTKFAMFHERHFNAVKTFLESVFPGCTATLVARSRPIVPDYRFSFDVGYASLSGMPGLFVGGGLAIGIPLDRLRRWEFVFGPQVRYLGAAGNQGSRDAFLLGARLALEGRTGSAGHGFTGGGFAELGYGRFSSTDYYSGVGTRTANTAYGEIGARIGYHPPLLEGIRFDIGLEGAAGTALGAPGIIGPLPPDIESDPQRTYWFRFGARAAMEW